MSSNDPAQNIREHLRPVTKQSSGPTLDMRESINPIGKPRDTQKLPDSVNKPSTDPNTQKILETTSHGADNSSQTDPNIKGADGSSGSSGNQGNPLYSQISAPKQDEGAPSQHSSSNNPTTKSSAEEVFSTKPEPKIQGTTEKHEANESGITNTDAQATQKDTQSSSEQKPPSDNQPEQIFSTKPEPKIQGATEKHEAGESGLTQSDTGAHQANTSESASQQNPEQVFQAKPEANIQGATEKHEAQESGVIGKDVGGQQKPTETSQQPSSQETTSEQSQSFISQITTKVTDTIKGVINEAQNYSGQAAETLKSAVPTSTDEATEKAKSAAPESANNAVSQARNAIPSANEVADRTKSSIPSTNEVVDKTKSSIPSANEVVEKAKNAIPNVDTSNIDTSQSSIGEGVKNYLGGGGSKQPPKVNEHSSKVDEQSTKVNEQPPNVNENDKVDKTQEQTSDKSGEQVAETKETGANLPVVAARSKDQGSKLVLEVDLGKPSDNGVQIGQANKDGQVQSVSLVTDSNVDNNEDSGLPTGSQPGEIGSVSGRGRGHPGSFSHEIGQLPTEAKSEETEPSEDKIGESIPGAFGEDENAEPGITGESLSKAFNGVKNAAKSASGGVQEKTTRKSEDVKQEGPASSNRDVSEDAKATEQAGLAREHDDATKEQQKQEWETKLGLSHSRQDSVNQGL